MEATNEKLDRILAELQKSNVAVRIPGLDLVAKLQDVPDRLNEIPKVIREEIKAREDIVIEMLKRAWERIYAKETQKVWIQRLAEMKNKIVQFIRNLFGTIQSARKLIVWLLIAGIFSTLFTIATNIATLTHKRTLVITLPITVAATVLAFRFLHPVLRDPPDEKQYELTWRSPGDLTIRPKRDVST